MESRRDSWRSVKKRVLEGHKAMTSLGEDDEDTPYPAPRPITGLPEPISKEELQDVFYSDSESGPSSMVEFKMDWKCTENTLKSGIRMSNISGSESEMDGINTQNTLKSGTEIDNPSEPSMKGVRRDIRNYIHTLHSTIVDLHFKNQHLCRDNKNLRSKYDACLKRYGILQGREETSDKVTEFTRKFLECSKYKGENGFQTVQDLKTEKGVKFCFGTKEHGGSPLLDPAVKAQVDKRLEAITRPGSDDQNDKRIVNDTENLKECSVFNREEPSIALCEEDNKGIVDSISIKGNVSKILDMVENINSKDSEHKPLDTEHSISIKDKDNQPKQLDMVEITNRRDSEHKPLDIEDSISIKDKDNEPKQLDMVEITNIRDSEQKPLDIEDSISIKDSEHKPLDIEDSISTKDSEHKPLGIEDKNKTKSKRRPSNMGTNNSVYYTRDKDTQSYNITGGYLTCEILTPSYMKQEKKTVAKNDNTLEEANANTGKEAQITYKMLSPRSEHNTLTEAQRTCEMISTGNQHNTLTEANANTEKETQRTYEMISPRSKESVRLDVDALDMDVKRILNEVEKLESYLEDKAEYKAAIDNMPSINGSLNCEKSLGKYNKLTPMLNEIEKLGNLFEDTSEDDSVMEGRNTINNTPSIEETTKYTLGKYKTLPPIGRISTDLSTTQNGDGKKAKQRSTSNDGTSKINSHHALTKVTIKHTGSYTSKENKNKSRLVKLLPLLKEQATTRNTFLNIKSSSNNNNQSLPKIKSIKLKDAAKGEPTTGNTCSDYSNIKSPSKNNNQTLPKIKSIKPKDTTKGNITLTKKIKLPVLPSLLKATQALPNPMKATQTLPRMYEPRPPTTKQSKRPYTGKYNKLPFK